MQKAVMLLLVFLITLNMSFSCCADSFRDNCSSMEEFPYRKVYNLNVANSYLENLNFPLQDRTALEITDYTDYGEIIYEANEVEEVTFSIYRKYPSFAVKFLDDDDSSDANNLAYGIIPSAETYSMPIPLFMDESDESLYCEDNHKWYLLTFDNMEFVEVQNPSNPLIPYGAEVQVSNDGQTYDSVPLEMFAPKSLSDEYYLYEETFHAYLPEDTTHIKIRIKQVPTLRNKPSDESQPTYSPINVEHSTMIRTIAFIGPKSDFKPEEKPEGKPNVTPQTIIINPLPKTEKPEKPHKPSNEKSASSPQSSSGSTRSGNNTTSETTTSDSNNTTNNTTTYTSNYYFINLGEENAEAVKNALAKIGVEVGDTAENDEIAEEKSEEVIRVLYDDSLTVGSSGKEINTQMTTTPKDTENQDNKILYLLAGGILASILIQIFHFLKQPSQSDKEAPKEDFDDTQNTEDDRF